MGSRSSPRRSASPVNLRALDLVLQDGAVFDTPNTEAEEAAQALQKIGLIDLAQEAFALCSNRRDPDFPPPSRGCLGRVEIGGVGDRGVCPECGREVDLLDAEKQRFTRFRVHIRTDAIMDYLTAAATDFPSTLRIDAGVLRIRHNPVDLYICVPELCSDGYRMRRDTATMEPTVFVTLAPNAGHRMLGEEWLIQTSLAAIVGGEASLNELLHRAENQKRPAMLLNVSVPIYATGPKPIVAAMPRQADIRRFVLHITPDVALVEGVLVANKKARTQLAILQIFAKAFARSILTMGRQAPLPLSADDVADRLQRLDRQEKADRETTRRTINRLQESIEDRVKQELGLPIGREDVIQSIRWQGGKEKYGYRLHPEHVVIGLNLAAES